MNAALVFVTINYAATTKDILKDGEKASKIEFVQKQLESFYYPWLRVMADVEDVYFKVDRDAVPDDMFYMHCLDEIYPVFIKGDLELHKYQYLANKDTLWVLLNIERDLGFTPMTIDPKLMENVTGMHYEETDEHYGYIPDELVYHEQELIFSNVMSFKSNIESEIERLNNRLSGLLE